MSIDLTLLPFDCDSELLSFSHNVLQLNRDYDLFGKIDKLPQLEVPNNFSSYLSRDEEYEEPHYGNTTETPYGNKLQYTTAGELKKCNINGPAGAYINALPDQNKVALYWH